MDTNEPLPTGDNPEPRRRPYRDAQGRILIDALDLPGPITVCALVLPNRYRLKLRDHRFEIRYGEHILSVHRSAINTCGAYIRHDQFPRPCPSPVWVNGMHRELERIITGRTPHARKKFIDYDAEFRRIIERSGL